MNTHAKNIIREFKNKNILVLGDFMLDIYLDGCCERLAPEASVPVLDINKDSSYLGGSGNVVQQLCNLGATVQYVTVLGQDEPAKKSIQLLKQAGVASLCLHFTELSPTLTKTRLLMEGKYLYRFDIGKKIEMEENLLQRYLQDIEKAYAKCDAVFISDYNKGSIPNAVIQLLTQLKEKQEKPIALDCKDYQQYKSLSPTLIKPNYIEALELTGEIESEDRIAQAMQWGEKIWNLSHAQVIALSMDKAGVVLCRRGEPVFHYPVTSVKAVNTSGAGDVLLSTLLLAYICGASDYECAQIATTAAHIAIQKSSTASCTLSELKLGLIAQSGKIIYDLDTAACLAEILRTDKKIVFTNGCFDIFHSGHAQYLAQAKKLGDILVVGINADESVRRIKGKGRPVNRIVDRLEVLKQLECVDYLIPFGTLEDDTPSTVIEAIKPHVFVKGQDYQNGELPEKETLEKLGTAIQFISYLPHQSTTKIIERIQQKDLVVLKKIG